MEIIDKFVDFYSYCTSCKHEQKTEQDEPCCRCLENPVNANTSKPVNWEAKE